MDDKNKTQTQTQYQQPQQSQVGGGDAQGQIQTQQQPQVGSGGALVKERELFVTPSAGPSVSEFVKPSGVEAEPRIHDELEKIGVRRVREFPEVGHEEQGIGIKESMPPVKTEPTGLVQTPMTEEEAKQTLKHEKPTASIMWIAALVVKYFKKMHRRLLTSKN